MTRQNAFRHRLQNVSSPHNSLSSPHTKSCSDSILFDLENFKATLQQEGVLFEIINPRQSLELARIVSSPSTRCQSYDSSKVQGISVVSASTMSSGEEFSMRPSKLQPEDAQRRPTAPLRWLLNDLPSAHTSIPRVQGPKIPSPSPGLMNSDDPFAHLPRCRDLPRTPAHLIRPGPLYNQPGQVQAFPFDSQSAGSPPTALEEDETVLNASTPATTHNRSSKTSLSSVKSLTEKFAKIFVKPLKQVDAAKDRVSNKFLAPRPKLSRTESIHRKPKKLSKKTGESKPGVSAESGERDKNNLVCQSARPLNRDLNQNQPNFHGARGRVEKSTAINDVIRKGSVKGSKTRFGKDPVWAAARRRQSVSIPEEFQIPNSDSEETDSEDRSIDEEVQRKARIGLIGETPETPLPSVTERLNASNEGHESPLQIARPSSSSGHIHHLNRHEAPLHMNPVTSGHPHEHAENDIGEPGPAIHEDQGWDDGSSQPGQGAGPNATGHNAVPFNPFVNQGSTGTSPAFIPYVNSVGTLDAYVPGQFGPAGRVRRSNNTQASIHDSHSSTGEQVPAFLREIPEVRVEERESGRLQSSSSQPQDHGPEESQTLPSQRLGGRTSSSTLRSRFRLPSGLRNMRSISTLRSRVRHNRFPLGQDQSRVLDSHESETTEDDEQDWETIAESQQYLRDTFGTFAGHAGPRSGYADSYTQLGQAVTGSSLANFSSRGSLAQEETTNWTPINSPPQLISFSHPPSLPSNAANLRAARRALPHSRRLEPRGGRSAFLEQGADPGQSATFGEARNQNRDDCKFNFPEQIYIPEEDTNEHMNSMNVDRIALIQSSGRQLSSITPFPPRIQTDTSSNWATLTPTRQDSSVFGHFPSFPYQRLSSSQSCLRTSCQDVSFRNSLSHRTSTSLPSTQLHSSITVHKVRHGSRVADINRKRRATFSGLPLNDNLGASTAAPSTAANSVTRNSARASKRKPSDAQVRERLRAMDTVVLADIARPRASVLLWDLQGSSPRRQGTTAANGDEETACSSPAVWYWSSPGYVFPEPPRLSQAPQRHAQASTMSNIVVQRRLGRVLLGVLSLLPLAGWIVVTLIGLGVSGPDRLMKWYSRGVVDSFHDRERRLARWACGIYVVVLLVAVFVPTVVVLVVRAR